MAAQASSFTPRFRDLIPSANLSRYIQIVPYFRHGRLTYMARDLREQHCYHAVKPRGLGLERSPSVPIGTAMNRRICINSSYSAVAVVLVVDPSGRLRSSIDETAT